MAAHAAPAPAGEHVTSLRPLPFWKVPTFRKRAARAGAVVVLLAIAIAALQVARSHEPVTRASSAPAPIPTPAAGPPSAATPAPAANVAGGTH